MPLSCLTEKQDMSYATAQRMCNSRKSVIRKIARLFVPKRYRPSVKKWILSLLGVCPELSSAAFAAVYCGSNRIMAFHPRTEFMYLDANDLSVTPRIIINNYERHVTRALGALVRPGFVVVECGANQGFHTLSMAILVGPGGRILAFEPDPRNLKVLKDNIRTHYLDATVTVIPKAACNENGPLPFFRGKSGAQSSLLPLRADAGPWASCYFSEQEARIEVEGTRVSAELAERGLIPDLIRLDVEGAEPMALEGMWDHLENIPHIVVIFEYNPWCIRQGKGWTPEDFINKLSRLGMNFWLIRGEGVLVPSSPEEILATPDYILHDVVACRSPELVKRGQ